jgi:hypothetical protein
MLWAKVAEWQISSNQPPCGESTIAVHVCMVLQVFVMPACGISAVLCCDVQGYGFGFRPAEVRNSISNSLQGRLDASVRHILCGKA